uniref:Uncharacterized protein n=1 Tax=Solibacter usitatus (strain Ellin6076) TaxID=234267 RepID=Q01VA4_SOLUE
MPPGGRRKSDSLWPSALSDLGDTKRKPVLVLAATRGDDLILYQISSQATADEYSINLERLDFTSFGLNQSSRIRPNRLLTADRGIVLLCRTSRHGETR